MKIDGFIFDFDGTLGDSFPLILSAFKSALARHLGREYTDEEITAHFGVTEEGMLRRMAPGCWEACLAAYLEEYDRMHPLRARLFPGIVDVLTLLKQRGARLAIVTGKGPRSMAISLRHLGLADYFSQVEVGSAEQPEKPRAIRKVVSGWGLPPGTVAYVGDAGYDMESAREAGVIPLGAGWAGTADIKGLGRTTPAKLFTSVGSFLDWLQKEVELPGDRKVADNASR